jgi:acyl-CoA synthetase (NDP forming)
MMAMKFTGPVYFVNPNRSEIFGKKSYRSAAELPGQIDLAFVVVPAEKVLSALEDCAGAGATAAIVVANGFAESKEAAGKDRQRRLIEFANRTGMAICGPSCLGVISAHDGFEAFAGTRMSPARPGSVAILAQSGALSHACMSEAAERGLGLSYVVSSGNEACLEACDYFEYFLHDDQTSVICAVAESFKNDEHLVRIGELSVQVKKPIIVLKLGRSAASSRMAISHTGAMAGSEVFYDTIFRQYGMQAAHDLGDLMDRAAGLCYGVTNQTPVRNLGIVSGSGGAAGSLSDLVTEIGVEVPAFGGQLLTQIENLVPKNITVQNPLEFGRQAQAEVPRAFERIVEAFAASDALDGVAVVDALPLDTRRIAQLGESQRHFGKPVLLTGIVGGMPVCEPDGQDQLRKEGVLVFRDLVSAQVGLAARNSYVEYLRNLPAGMAGTSESPPNRAPVKLQRPASRVLHDVEARAMLRDFGITSADEIMVAGYADAVDAAAQLGYPVVLKALVPEVAHRSDLGLVVPGLRDAGELQQAWRAMDAQVRQLPEAARAHSAVLYLVQQHVKGVAEVIVGVDCRAGGVPMLTVGGGGIFVELVRDVTRRILPLTRAEADAMLDEVQVGRLLNGYRGSAAGDRPALIDAIMGIVEFCQCASGWLEEMEVNPFIVMPLGSGVKAVDALISSRDQD